MTYASSLIPLQVLLPLLFALGLMPRSGALAHRRAALVYGLVTSGITFILALGMAAAFNWSAPGTIQLAGRGTWIPAAGLHFSYGVDALSLWLVLIAVGLMPLATLNAAGEDIEAQRDRRSFLFWLKILEASLVLTFVARDAILFYVGFEFTIVPVFFLIGLFGDRDRLKAAATYFFYSFTGSLLTLIAILYVAYAHAQGADGTWSFEMTDLYATARGLPAMQQGWVLTGLLIGFAVKTPLWPVHGYLPFAHAEAPTGGSVDLAGLVLKLGPYGIIRLALPMCPVMVVAFAPYLGGLAVLGILYAALICWVQQDAKKLIGYASVSHMGFVMLGLFALDSHDLGATGAMYYTMTYVLAAGGMLLCVGMVYRRLRTRRLDAMSGLARRMPVWAFFMALFVFASVGLPGLNGFVGEFLTLIGAFNAPGTLGPRYAAAGALGVILAAIYLLYMLGRMVLGPLRVPGGDDTAAKDLSPREIGVLAPLAVACVVLGLFPGVILGPVSQPVGRLTAAAKQVVAAQKVEGRKVEGQKSKSKALQTALDPLDNRTWPGDEDVLTFRPATFRLSDFRLSTFDPEEAR